MAKTGVTEIEMSIDIISATMDVRYVIRDLKERRVLIRDWDLYPL